MRMGAPSTYARVERLSSLTSCLDFTHNFCVLTPAPDSINYFWSYSNSWMMFTLSMAVIRSGIRSIVESIHCHIDITHSMTLHACMCSVLLILITQCSAYHSMYLPKSSMIWSYTWSGPLLVRQTWRYNSSLCDEIPIASWSYCYNFRNSRLFRGNVCGLLFLSIFVIGRWCSPSLVRSCCGFCVVEFIYRNITLSINSLVYNSCSHVHIKCIRHR